MMSTGSASFGAASSGRAENDQPHSSKAARSAEIVKPVFISGSFTNPVPPP
jgi:hypothetical protein